MSQQPPTGWGPQQPSQYPPPVPPPAPRKSWMARHKILTGLGAFIVFIIVISVATSGGSKDDASTAQAAAPTATASPDAKKDDKAKPKEKKPASKPKTKPKKDKPKQVVFKVWGTAPAGALGSLDITYGSDSDTRDGKWTNGTFEATLPLNGDAMYYTITAQLQGSGDINCSVTVDGKTKKGHASGSYNICDAQLSNGLFGDWD